MNITANAGQKFNIVATAEIVLSDDQPRSLQVNNATINSSSISVNFDLVIDEYDADREIDLDQLVLKMFGNSSNVRISDIGVKKIA